MRVVACLAALLASALLAACGGGGGGAVEAPPAPNFSVSFDRGTLSFEYYENDPVPGQVIVATGHGDPGGALYIVPVTEGDAIAAGGVSIQFLGMQALIAVTPRSDLVAGTYTGRVILQACADAQCTRHFAGSPFVVSLTSVVRERLRATPAHVDATTASGQPIDMRVAVRSSAGHDFAVAVEAGGEWLSVTDVDATGFSVKSLPLPGGDYIGQVRVTSGPHQQVVPVRATVTAATYERDLQLGTSAIALAAPASGAPVAQDVLVTPPSWNAAVTAEVAAGAPWLSVAPKGNGTWAFRADPAALADGTYEAAVTFRSGFPSVPRSIAVTFVVGPGLVVPALQPLIVTSDVTAPMLAGSMPMRAADNAPFNWFATTNVPWLKLDTAAGIAGGTLAWHVDVDAFAALPNFADHDARINIVTDLAAAPAGTTTVRVSKTLAELHVVAPYLVTRGRPARVLVQGRGFRSGGLNPGQRLVFDGVTPIGVTPLTDRQVEVRLPPMDAAAITVRATNALGVDAGTFTLRTALAAAVPYAALDTAGVGKSLTWDAERRALYVVRPATHGNALVRLEHDGTHWIPMGMIDDLLFDVALSPDGRALIAAMSDGELRWLDPATGIETRPRFQSGYPLGDDRERFMAAGLAITADSRLWLAQDMAPGSQFKALAYVDLRTDTVTRLGNLNGDFLFYRGPYFGMPRDGSRLLGRQNEGISGGHPSIYDAIKHDVATGVTSRTVDVTAPFDIRFTHDGRLALVDLEKLIDRYDDLHGWARLPAGDRPGWIVVAAQVASDGARVFLLAYPNRGADDAALSGARPRIYVVDSSAPSAGDLPVLGYFEIDDYPSSCVAASAACWYGLASTLSPDDGTLFFYGTRATVVVPIPATLQPAALKTRPAWAWATAATR